MFRKENDGQMKFEDQFFGSSDPVSDDHDYMKLVRFLNWDELLEKFKKYYSPRGRGSIPVKNMIILLLVKHMENISDDELIHRLSVDLALQKALNITFLEAQVKVHYIEKRGKRIRKVKGYIDPSGLTYFRKRIGKQGVELIEKSVEQFVKDQKLIRSKTVLVDTTVCPSNIAYPTDMNLLEKSRECLVSLIKKFSDKKVRTRNRTAKRLFLKHLKIKSKDKTQSMLCHKEMIKFVSRNLKQAKKVLKGHCTSLTTKNREKLEQMLCVIGTLLEQQKEVARQTAADGSKKGIKIKNRIVSIFKSHVRPIPRGKIPQPTEFGAKVLYESQDNFIKPLMISFNNTSDVDMLAPFFSRWMNLILGGDRGFHSPKNTKLAQQHKLRGYCVATKGKVKKAMSLAEKRVKKKRSGIEAKFSLLKRKYGIRKNLYSRGETGEIQWIFLGAIGHNLRRTFSLI